MEFTVSKSGKDVPLVQTTSNMTDVAMVVCGYPKMHVNFYVGRECVHSETFKETGKATSLGFATGHMFSDSLHKAAELKADYMDIIV